jgi:biopolymer transport protein ExbB
MIEIFGSQNAGGANPAQLAHGISVALYNTGFGLAIAMPSLVFYRHFRALVDTFIVDLEQQAFKFVEIVHGNRN